MRSTFGNHRTELRAEHSHIFDQHSAKPFESRKCIPTYTDEGVADRRILAELYVLGQRLKDLVHHPCLIH